jgi:hypothetical protein
MLFTLNLYIWKYILPSLKQDLFKSKIFSLFTLLYISVFSLPRKFLLHYFFGKGKQFQVDTQKLISENPLVYQKIKSELFSLSNRDKSGVLRVSQSDLFDPQFRYSIGSFEINYSVENEKVVFRAASKYRYGQNNNRLSMHLHNWLNQFAKNGQANDFQIIGTDWSIDLLEFRQKNIQFTNSFIKKGGPSLGKLLM